MIAKTLIASLFVAAVAVSPASADTSPAGEIGRIDAPASVQTAGYYDRARAYVRRAMRRRYRVRSPRAVAGVRG